MLNIKFVLIGLPAFFSLHSKVSFSISELQNTEEQGCRGRKK